MDHLVQSRSLRVAWHLAHQHRRQMPPDLLAGIDANTRNKIAFTLEGTDAKAVSAGSGLTPEDFTQLPPYAIYASLLSEGRQTGWFSGRTLPPTKAIADPDAVIRESQARYGADPKPAAPGSGSAPSPSECLTASESDEEPIGRRPRKEPT